MLHINKVAILFKALIVGKSVDCPSVSLHDMFLYGAPSKLTLDHVQSVFFVILY